MIRLNTISIEINARLQGDPSPENTDSEDFDDTDDIYIEIIPAINGYIRRNTITGQEQYVQTQFVLLDEITVHPSRTYPTQ